ncbi:hypothetical protein DFH08DRAFT_907027 [Mycena albidolilacea]|uniref:Uncharacterized protein n=1 Tax=Mycena albidolilacea TaxID=1033008 RepID=A0AAD6YXT6_9AGAR|nr:hypothetical protein DFH08DRAFT_907027 [Mycena albidolilacea]
MMWEILQAVESDEVQVEGDRGEDKGVHFRPRSACLLLPGLPGIEDSACASFTAGPLPAVPLHQCRLFPNPTIFCAPDPRSARNPIANGQLKSRLALCIFTIPLTALAALTLCFPATTLHAHRIRRRLPHQFTWPCLRLLAPALHPHIYLSRVFTAHSQNPSLL